MPVVHLLADRVCRSVFWLQPSLLRRVDWGLPDRLLHCAVWSRGYLTAAALSSTALCVLSAASSVCPSFSPHAGGDASHVAAALRPNILSEPLTLL